MCNCHGSVVVFLQCILYVCSVYICVCINLFVCFRVSCGSWYGLA